jgi:prolyl-tRNA synthetase
MMSSKSVLKRTVDSILAHWDGTELKQKRRSKKKQKQQYSCIPFDRDEEEEGVCMYSGKPSKGRVIFAKAY